MPLLDPDCARKSLFPEIHRGPRPAPDHAVESGGAGLYPFL